MLSLSDPPQSWKTSAKFPMGTGYTFLFFFFFKFYFIFKLYIIVLVLPNFYRVEELQDGVIKSQKKELI